MGLSSRLRSRLGLAIALLAAASPLAAQTGTISGRVTDASTQRPLAGAQVQVSGATRSAVTNADGDYTLAVAAGSVTVRASTLGYSSQSRTVTVAAGQATTANFALQTSAISLNELVVTGTPGATEKRELGNSVTTVHAADITDKAPVTNVTQLLAARAPGLTIMQPSGSLGTAAAIRIRGLGSVQAGNAPIFYIDGVRMFGGNQGGFGVGGQTASNLDAINPNDIESIEVIKGPAAATLYGADAAAGVIQIITKKGRTGRQSLQWSGKVEMGNNEWKEGMPTNYTLCTAARIASASWPGCAGLAANTVITERPLESALETGDIRNFNLNVRGGGERFSFYLSGDREDETGVFVNNEFARTSGRGNFSVTPSDFFDVTGSIAFSRTDLVFPLNDNASNGWLRNSFRGLPGAVTPFASGWRGLGPEQMKIYDNTRENERFILGLTANYQPAKWFRNRITAGVDAFSYRNNLFYLQDLSGLQPYGAIAATGARYVFNPEVRLWTLDYAGTITKDVNSELTSNTSFGMQMSANSTKSWEVWCEGTVANELTDCDQTVTRTVFEGYSEQNSLGYFVQQQMGWRERLYVAGAVRVDDNSAFGNDFSLVVYPKASLSWVISDEPFFGVPFVDNLKLRTAWGQAGNSPAPFTADRAYAGAALVVPVDQSAAEVLVPAIRSSSYGNPNLKAETGSEFELGFDASFLEGRLGTEVTFYNKHTYDALLSVPVTPAAGIAGTILDNVGEIANRGLEVSLFGTPIQSDKVTWETQLAYSTNRNEFVTFGGSRDEPILLGYGGGAQQITPGYPMAGYWARPLVKNADGTYQIVAGRGVLAPDAVFIGPAIPTKEASLANTVTLFGNLRLYGFVDYKGGHYLFNMTEQTRSADGNTELVNDVNADPALIQVLRTPGNNFSFIQPADFIKLREVSATYTFPKRMTQRFGADNVAFSLAGRNLGILWKKYPGADPETNIEGSDQFTRGDYMSVPMIRRLVATLSVSF